MRPWQIRRFVLSSTVLEFKPGEYVFRRGDRSNELYLVMKGVVEVSVAKEGAGGRMVIDQFGSGELFGDVALLAQVPRHADAVALVPTSVLVLSRGGAEEHDVSAPAARVQAVSQSGGGHQQALGAPGAAIKASRRCAGCGRNFQRRDQGTGAAGK